MPNWVYNSIDCSDKNVFNFIKKNCLDDKRKNFTFKKLLPMPKVLKYVTLPTKVISDKKFRHQFFSDRGGNIISAESTWDPDLLQQGIAKDCISESAGKKLLEKYGAQSWYEWSCKVWGCKWDASETYINPENNEVGFSTPWSPPEGFIKSFAAAMAKEYPEHAPFTWEWEEEQGFGESLEIVGGKCNCIKSWKKFEKVYDLTPLNVRRKETDMYDALSYSLIRSEQKVKNFSDTWKFSSNVTWDAISKKAPYYTAEQCDSPLEAIVKCMEREGAVITKIPETIMPLIQDMDLAEVFDCLSKYKEHFSDDAREQIFPKAPFQIVKRRTIRP